MITVTTAAPIMTVAGLTASNEGHQLVRDEQASVKENNMTSIGGKGAKGLRGGKGAKGAKGAKDAKGAKGAKDAKGAKGAKGAKYAKGAKGAKDTKDTKDTKGSHTTELRDTDKRVLRTREKAVSKHLFNFDNYIKDDSIDYTQLIKVTNKGVKDPSLLVRPKPDNEESHTEGEVMIPLGLTITNELYDNDNKGQDINDFDPLNDENYMAYHRRMERTERQIQNQEKERIGFEKERMERQLGYIKSQDWPKSLLQITAINNPLDKEEMELKRDMTERELRQLLDRFKQWKIQDKYQHSWRKMLLENEGGANTQALYVKNYGFGSGIKRLKLSLKDNQDNLTSLSPTNSLLESVSSSSTSSQRQSRAKKDADMATFHPSQVQRRGPNGKFLPRVGGGKRFPMMPMDDKKAVVKKGVSGPVVGDKKVVKRQPKVSTAESKPEALRMAVVTTAIPPTTKILTTPKTPIVPSVPSVPLVPFKSFYEKTYLKPKFEDLVLKKKHQRNVLPFGRLMPVMDVVDFDLVMPVDWCNKRNTTK